MGLSLIAANNIEAEIRMLEADVACTRPGTAQAQAQIVELEILRARRSVKWAADSLERAKRTQMTIDVARKDSSVRSYFYMLADSHKIVTHYTEALAQAQAKLAKAYARR